MNILELATTKHNEWIAMAKSLGCGDFSEDIVQEMYIKLHKYVGQSERVMYGDEINKGFVYITLRNLVYDLKRAQNKSREILETDVDYEKLIIQDEPTDNTLNELDALVMEEIQNWHWYDRMVFLYVYDKGVPQRELARETQIGLFSIHNTIKNGKQRIKAAAEKKNAQA